MSDDDDEPELEATAPAKANNGLANLRPWPPGVSGNPAGRKPGSRNQLAEAFLADLHDDWQTHGKQAIVDAREADALGYLRVVASILPKELKVSTASELSDDELRTRLLEYAAQLGHVIDLAASSVGVPRDRGGAEAAGGEAVAPALPAVPKAD